MFLINIPVVIIFIVFAPWLLKEVREKQIGRIDVTSLLISIVTLFSFTYAIKAIATQGLSTQPVLLGLFGVVLFFIFVKRQKHIENPLLDISLFKDRVFTIAIMTGILSLVVWSATGYLCGIYLQSVLGYNVFHAALLAVPGVMVLALTCIGTNWIVGKIGRKLALVFTHFLISGGVALLLFADVNNGVLPYLACTIIAGVGFGLAFTLVVEITVSVVPREKAGAAASLAETTNEIGNALGITLPGSLAAYYFRINGPAVANTLNETLTITSADHIAAESAQLAFVGGMHVALATASIGTLILGIVALIWLPKSMPNQ